MVWEFRVPCAALPFLSSSQHLLLWLQPSAVFCGRWSSCYLNSPEGLGLVRFRVRVSTLPTYGERRSCCELLAQGVTNPYGNLWSPSVHAGRNPGFRVQGLGI